MNIQYIKTPSEKKPEREENNDREVLRLVVAITWVLITLWLYITAINSYVPYSS